jgi:hypothetical protein
MQAPRQAHWAITVPSLRCADGTSSSHMYMQERRMPLLTAKNAVVEDVEGLNMPLAGPISFPATSARLNSTFSPVTNPLQK